MALDPDGGGDVLIRSEYVGDLFVRPPATGDYAGGAHPLMVVSVDGEDDAALGRTDVERLRELCDEALS